MIAVLKNGTTEKQIDSICTWLKKQGLDVTKYTRKRITRYTYEVTNFDADGKVYANLFVYKNRIIACDVSSLDGDGFVYPMTQIPEGLLK